MTLAVGADSGCLVARESDSRGDWHPLLHHMRETMDRHGATSIVGTTTVTTTATTPTTTATNHQPITTNHHHQPPPNTNPNHSGVRVLKVTPGLIARLRTWTILGSSGNTGQVMRQSEGTAVNVHTVMDVEQFDHKLIPPLQWRLTCGAGSHPF